MCFIERKRIARVRKASWDGGGVWKIAFISEIAHTCFIWHSDPNARQAACSPASQACDYSNKEHALT